MESMGLHNVRCINGKSWGKIRHRGFRGNGLHGDIFQRHGSENDWRVVMMDEGGVEVDGKSDEAMLKVICETDAGGMNHVIRVVPSDVLSPVWLWLSSCGCVASWGFTVPITFIICMMCRVFGSLVLVGHFQAMHGKFNVLEVGSKLKRR